MIGPFPDKTGKPGSRSGIDSVYPPEIAFERERVYKGLNGKAVKWQILKTSKDGFLSFDSLIRSNQSAIFLNIFSVTTIPSSTTSPVASTIPSKVSTLMEKPKR